MSLYRKAKPDESVNTPVNTSAAVNTEQKPAVNTDRHRPGYMAEYMRKRRARKAR